MKSYAYRIAQDWIKTHSDDSLIATWRDPLMVIEVIIESSYSLSWEIIICVLEIDEKGDSLIDLIYGPLESWISRYSSAFIELIEAEALTNGRFRWALGGLIRPTKLSPIWERIDAACGGPWPQDEFEVPEK